MFNKLRVFSRIKMLEGRIGKLIDRLAELEAARKVMKCKCKCDDKPKKVKKKKVVKKKG